MTIASCERSARLGGSAAAGRIRLTTGSRKAVGSMLAGSAFAAGVLVGTQEAWLYVAAASAEPSSQLTSWTPSTTATTDSPSTMIVSSPKRSGMCPGWRGVADLRRRAKSGVVSSSAIAQSYQRQGGSTKSDATQKTTASENLLVKSFASGRATST